MSADSGGEADLTGAAPVAAGRPSAARLYLIDGLFHTFRAFYALPRSMQAPDGTPTNAVHGFLGILRRLLREERAEMMVAVFEKLTGIFREEIYPEYKTNRAEVDARLLAQVPLIQEMCRRLGVPVLEVDGFEADDVIATLAKRALAVGHPVSIVSNDKDLAQILALDGDLAMMLVERAGTVWLRPADVAARFGVAPALIPSLLALRGDAVDNIPGLAGVGQKTAVRLLEEYGPLESLLAAAPGMAKAPLRESLAAEAGRLRRDLVVATVRYDVPLPHGWENSAAWTLGEVRGAAAHLAALGMKRASQETAAWEGRRLTTVSP